MSASDPFTHAHPELQFQKYVVFVDPNRRFIACSDGVYSLLGYDRSEILSKKIDDISFLPYGTATLFGRLMDEGQLQGRYLLRHKSGRPVSVRYRSWTFSDGCLAAVWEPAERWVQLYHAALLEVDSQRQDAACKLALAEAVQRQATVKPEDAATETAIELDHAIRELRKMLRR